MKNEKIELCLLNYRNLVGKIDEKCNEIASGFSQHLKCRKGCSQCCILEAVFPVEAVSIAVEVINRKIKIRTERDNGLCNFLENGLCMIYDVRPIICRTHGFPVFFEEGGVQKADCCPLNFTEADETSSKAFIDIDKINSILYSINSLFIKELNLPFKPDERIFLTDIEKFI